MDPYDTVDLALYVLYPDCDDVGGNCVIADDDGGAGVPESVTFDATSGQTYYVIVDGYGGNSGGYDLTISESTSAGCQLVDLHADLDGSVWEDSDADGIQDPDESTLVNGVTVNLFLSAGGALVDSFTTGWQAPSYLFYDLDEGLYYLEFVVPDGYKLSPQDQGVDDDVDSDPNPITRKTAPFQLLPGEYDTSRDAGMYRVYHVYLPYVARP
jgi:hypothetical protein